MLSAERTRDSDFPAPALYECSAHQACGLLHSDLPTEQRYISAGFCFLSYIIMCRATLCLRLHRSSPALKKTTPRKTRGFLITMKKRRFLRLAAATHARVHSAQRPTPSVHLIRVCGIRSGTAPSAASLPSCKSAPQGHHLFTDRPASIPKTG